MLLKSSVTIYWEFIKNLEGGISRIYQLAGCNYPKKLLNSEVEGVKNKKISNKLKKYGTPLVFFKIKNISGLNNLKYNLLVI